MKKLLSLLLIVLLLTSSLQVASADVYKGDIVKFYGDMCALSTAKEWGEDEFNRTYFSAAAFMDLMNFINDEAEFRAFGSTVIYAAENDILGFAYNTDTIMAIFGGSEVMAMVAYLPEYNALQYRFVSLDEITDDMMLPSAQMIVESEGYKFFQLNSSLFNGCLGVLGEMFPAGSSASTDVEDTSVPSVSPAAAEDTAVPAESSPVPVEGTTVTVTADRLSLRNANGSAITSIAKGASFIITGYDASVGMFTAEYDGMTGYVKGTGLNIPQNELLNLFQ